MQLAVYIIVNGKSVCDRFCSTFLRLRAKHLIIIHPKRNTYNRKTNTFLNVTTSYRAHKRIIMLSQFFAALLLRRLHQYSFSYSTCKTVIAIQPTRITALQLTKRHYNVILAIRKARVTNSICVRTTCSLRRYYSYSKDTYNVIRYSYWKDTCNSISAIHTSPQNSISAIRMNGMRPVIFITIRMKCSPLYIYIYIYSNDTYNNIIVFRTICITILFISKRRLAQYFTRNYSNENVN